MEVNKLTKKKRKAIDEQNWLVAAESCSSLGTLYSDQGEHEKALGEFKFLLSTYKRLNKTIEMATAHRMIGETYSEMVKYDQALSHINIYLKTAQTENNKVEQQRAFATLGRVYLLQGQTDEDNNKAFRLAEKSFIKSLLLCQELKGQIAKTEFNDMQARLYLNIGVTKENVADYPESMRYYDKAIQMCQANDLHELLHQCYTTAGLLYSSKLNDTAKSLKMLNSALEVAKRLSNKSLKMCETLSLKGDVLIKMGDFQSAKQVLHKAYKIQSPDTDDREKIEKTLKIVAAICYTEDSLITADPEDYKGKKTFYEKMGDGACKLENYTIGAVYYQKMLQNAKLNGDADKALIPCYISLYQTYIDNKEYEKALEYLDEELQLIENEPSEAFNTLLNIGGVYESMGEAKGFWETERVYQRARREAQKMNDTKLERVALKKIVALHVKHDQQDLADGVKREAKLGGIDMDDGEDEQVEGSDESVEEEAAVGDTPDIGDDICLEDLSDSCSENEENLPKPLKATRPRRQTFAVRRNCKGETQLHQACISGNAILARRLIDQGHPVAIRDHAGWLPLHEACIHGRKEIAEMLLDKDRSTLNDKGGTSCDGITPLYDACSNGNLEIVELLLDRGANVTAKTDFGETVLDALEKWHDIVRLDQTQEIFYDTIRERIYKSLDKVVDISASRRKNQTTVVRPSPGTMVVDLYPTPSNSTIASTEPRSGSRQSRVIGRMRQGVVYSDDSESDENELVSSTKPISLDFEEDRPAPVRTPLKNPSVTKKAPAKTNACSEYKNVMQNLRHRFSGKDDDKHTIDAGTSKKRAGYLDRMEVGEDWLDDDLGPNKKRQKIFSDVPRLPPTTKTSQKRPSNSREPSTDRQKSKENSVPPTPEKDDYASVVSIDDLFDEDSVDAFDMMALNEPAPHNKQAAPKRRRSNSKSSTTTPRNQTSLLDAGFARFRSESPVLESVASSMGLKRHDSFSRHLPDSTSQTAGGFGASEASPQKSAGLSVPMSVKVKVEDQLLLVPVNANAVNDLTIGWLAEETARRYYNLKGLRPELRLMTPDGAIFEGSDPISLAIGVNITSTVLDWKLPPLAQRYMESCAQAKTTVDQDLHNILDLCQSTQNLQLAHQNLTVNLVRPIFKALKHQTNLMFLDLSNNSLLNEGLKCLVAALPTLQQLTVLNLSNNLITAAGVDNLATIFDSAQEVLVNLHELMLAHNPLGNESVKSLARVCTNLPHLRKLSLAGCKLETFYEFDLNFGGLSDLDVSSNQLSSEALRRMLAKLNTCILTRLNLDFCCPKISDLGKHLAAIFDSGTGTCLTALHLANMNLTDSDLWEIVCAIKKCEGLKVLGLLQNPLTTVSLKYLFGKLPTLEALHLDGCNRLLRTLDGRTFLQDRAVGDWGQFPEMVSVSVAQDGAERFEQIDGLEALWKQCWGEKAKVEVCQTRVKLYVKKHL